MKDGFVLQGERGKFVWTYRPQNFRDRQVLRLELHGVLTFSALTGTELERKQLYLDGFEAYYEAGHNDLERIERYDLARQHGAIIKAQVLVPLDQLSEAAQLARAGLRYRYDMVPEAGFPYFDGGVVAGATCHHSYGSSKYVEISNIRCTLSVCGAAIDLVLDFDWVDHANWHRSHSTVRLPIPEAMITAISDLQQGLLL